MIEKIVVIKLIKGYFAKWELEDLTCQKIINENGGTLYSRDWDRRTRTRRVHCSYPSESNLQNAIRQVDREMFANGFVEEVVSTTDCIIKKAEERLSRIIDQQNEMIAERERICG